MYFKKSTTTPFSAQITFGLEKGHTQELLSKKELVSFIQEYQRALFNNKKNWIACSSERL